MRKLKTQKEIMATWVCDSIQPLVSICCIAYNHEQFIEDALEGFLIQRTDFPFEILIHDDASKDRTADIIREYESAYPNIIKPIYQTENQYSKGNRPGHINMSRAKGKFIALCEGDDYWTDPLKLQIQVDFLEEHSDYVITFHPCVSFDENGITDRHSSASKKDLSQEELKKAPSIHTRTVCFRNCLQKLPPEVYTARVGDLFLWSLLGNFGKGKYLKNIKPAYYRIHDGGIFSAIKYELAFDMMMSTKLALFCYYRRIGDIETSQYFAEWIMPMMIKIVGTKQFCFIVLRMSLNKIKYIIKRILKKETS